MKEVYVQYIKKILDILIFVYYAYTKIRFSGSETREDVCLLGIGANLLTALQGRRISGSDQFHPFGEAERKRKIFQGKGG